MSDTTPRSARFRFSKTLSAALFFAVFFAIFYYVTYQVLRGTELPSIVTAVITAFIGSLFGMILALPLYFWMASRRNHQPWYDRFYFFTYLGLAYINFLIFFVVARDLVAVVLNWVPVTETAISLYNDWAAATLLLLPFLCILVGTWVIRAGVQHREVIIRSEHLPPNFEGFRILHITDLHIGESLPNQFVKNLIQVSSKLNVDAVVFTGDILDGEAKRFDPDMQLLKQLQSRCGSFYVPGNHEYYWQAEHSVEAFRQLGFHILINETHTLEKDGEFLQVCGVPDPAAQIFNLETPNFEKLAMKLRPSAFKVLLSHQPSLADAAKPYGFHLQLSGHTHGGQFFPWNFLIGLFQKYPKGLYHVGPLQLYVNQGAGYWGPSVRLGTQCELAEIILTRGTV